MKPRDDETLEEFVLEADEEKPKRRKKPAPDGVPMIRPKRAPPPTPEQKVKMQSSPPSIRLEGLFEIEHRKKWGFLPIIKQGRDRKLLKDLAEQWGEKVTAKIIVAFFNSTDPQIRRCRFFNVPDFAYWAPNIRLSMSRRNGAAVGMNEKTASNAHEIAKAMGRGQQQEED